ncbi:alanine--glyoxylate aminotransferase family protein [Candidatus Roizmanbacteria bacterium]|nr:alanine--glyoxylate aminotransferase family protein [Candidatus Roizmanbacteria bacterium]
MQKTYFTPGPSQLHPKLPVFLKDALELQIGSISHRSTAFHDLFEQTVCSLRLLLSIPDEYQIFFVSSATEAMERIIQNGVEQSTLHFVNGAFSKLFYQTAIDYQKKAQIREVTPGQGFDCASISIPPEAELLAFTHNETSTGVLFPLEDIYAIKQSHPEKLIALDLVSSSPCVPVDFQHIDYAFFSVQKAFGLPAGLGVMIVSPRGVEKAQALQNRGSVIGSYHSLIKLQQAAQKNETPETPNVLSLFLLNRVVKDFLEEGIDAIQRKTIHKAQVLYDYFDAGTIHSCFVKTARFRSPTVVVVEVNGGSKPLIDFLKTKGIVMGSGYKEFKEYHIRIANFPALSEKDIQHLLDSISEYNG